MGIDTKANARAAALEVGDLHILEDGGERVGALVPEMVGIETASEGWRGDAVREQGCQRGADKNANTRGGAHSSEVTALPLSPSHSLDASQRSGALGSDVVAFETASEG
eukprot:scaffold4697_cov58-Phaeocystis_antarctica.AAC.2